jgi:hypothetical protein
MLLHTDNSYFETWWRWEGRAMAISTRRSLLFPSEAVIQRDCSLRFVESAQRCREADFLQSFCRPSPVDARGA